MSTLSGFKRSQFWSAKAASMYEGAPYRFNECMTEKKFDAILLALSYTNNNAPAYRDRFWEVRQSIVAWNENMAAIFTPSWVSCLDESMSPWSTQWNFLTFRKHLALALINNEWHGEKIVELPATRKRQGNHSLATAPKNH